MAKKKRKRRYAAPIGGLFFVLAFIGVATLVFSSISLTTRVLDNAREKTKIEDIIRPVLMFDPVPFENPADIDSTQILYFCMWHALMDPKKTNYSFNETQEMIIPASDLDAAAATLFGSDVVLQHKTFGEFETVYYYDRNRHRYQVPINAMLYVYSPRVEEIEQSGGYYHVRVGYIPPSGAWAVGSQWNTGEAAPDKYMVYVMRRIGNTYQIAAVRDDISSIGETHLPG